MVSGAFKNFKHEHIFTKSYDNKFDVDYTLMIDKFYFELPLGFIGQFVNTLFLKRYMTNLKKSRNKLFRIHAESQIK